VVDYVLIIGGVVCAWAALRVIGGERERRIRDLPAVIALNPADPAPVALAKPHKSPVR
jgi:hypothetical protein